MLDAAITYVDDEQSFFIDYGNRVVTRYSDGDVQGPHFEWADSYTPVRALCSALLSLGPFNQVSQG